MKPFHFFAVVALFVVSVLFVGNMFAQQAAQPEENQTTATDAEDEKDPPLPKLTEMKLPTAAELLQNPPVDWIVLVKDEVLVVEPVYPRPDTLAKIDAKRKASFKQPLPPTREELIEQRKKRIDMGYLEVIIPGEGVEPEYRVHIKTYVRSIIYHEDLILRRVDVFFKEKKLKQAFELLFFLQRKHPNWPGYRKRIDQLTFLEAQDFFQKGQLENALVYLENLQERTADFSGLQAEMGKVTTRIMEKAVAKNNYRHARYFLKRLKQRQPKSKVVPEWTSRLLSESTKLLDQSLVATREKKHDIAVELAEQASRVWPANPGLKDIFDTATTRFQNLRVGVVISSSTDSEYPFPTAAESRHAQLLQVSLFEVDRIDPAAHYHTHFCEEWNPEDLGRRTFFKLRQNRQYWESQQVVTASEIVTELASRLDPVGRHYDERFANYVDSLRVVSPFEFSIQFRRVPVRIESLLTLPVSSSPQTQNASTQTGLLPRFRRHDKEKYQTVFRRSISEPDGVREYHVAEITEVFYSDYDKAVQGLLRGEVSVLPQVQAKDLQTLRSDGRFLVRDYALPTTHLLQFNRNSGPLRNNQLRRALIYAIDRQKILTETMLQNSEPKRGRVVSAPFATKSHAYNAQVEPRQQDLPLAISLAVAASNKLGSDLPELKMYCPPNPIIEAAAKRLIEQWSRTGITVSLTTEANSNDQSWDIVYRTVRMAEPSAELWPLLAMNPHATVESISHLPDWLRQELINLDNSGDFKTAGTDLQKLHASLAAEVVMIPLWELDEAIVLRKNIRGIPLQFIHPYSNIERWVVQPWYPPELP